MLGVGNISHEVATMSIGERDRAEVGTLFQKHPHVLFHLDPLSKYTTSKPLL
jgi:ABC-type uncharacterized transport system ATPase subunit